MNLDHLTLAQLPPADRSEIDRLADAFAQITGPVTHAFQRIAAELGSTEGTIRTKYYAWLKRGKTALVNVARNPQFAAARQCAVPRETFKYFHSLCLENNRKNAPAFRQITLEYLEGKAIPGIPIGSRHCLPQGWSRKNFDKYAPTKFDTEAARKGKRAADAFRPLVFTTRKNLYPGQFLMMDEMWHNFEMVVLGRRQRVRPLQLHLHDVFSACQPARLIKGRIKREDETRAGINLSDVLFLVCYFLAKYGHHPKGTCIIVESGTATVPEEIRELITRLSDGLITWKLGSCKAERAFLGQYLGASKGDFKLKACLETSHNLIQNQAANVMLLPGQTGSNSRLNLPDELHGRQRHQDKLFHAMSLLPEELRSRLRHAFPIESDAINAIHHINDTINWRGALPWWADHEIEGFEEAGLITVDYHFSNGAICSGADYLQKTEEQMAVIAAASEPRARKLAPAEIFYPAAKQFERWRPEQLAQILWHARYDKPKTVTNRGLVEFDDEEISPGKLRYLATHLRPGDQIFCAANPMVPELLFIYDLQGRWIGTLKHWNDVPKEDEQAWAKRAGEAVREQNILLAPVAAAGLRQTRRMQSDAAHNAAILGVPITEASEAAARHAKQNADLEAEANEALRSMS